MANDVAIIGKNKRITAGHYQLPEKRKGHSMLFALFYVIAITVLIMHFTGFLARHNMEWLVLVLAGAVFPAVIYL